MKLFKALPAIVAAGALTAVAAAPVQAQLPEFRPFTWASTLTPTCTNAACSFTLAITGIGADLMGVPMPSVGISYGPPGAQLSNPNPQGTLSVPQQSSGFVEGFFVNILSGPGTFTSVTAPAGFNCSLINSNTGIACSDPSPFTLQPITFSATLSGGGEITQFSYNGAAYLGANPGTNVLGSNGVAYNVGSFTGRTNVNVVPEPETMALLASGLVGLGFASRRRAR